MHIRRQIVRWLIGITGFLLVLLIISAVFAPKLIKLETVKEYIVRQLAEEISAYRTAEGLRPVGQITADEEEGEILELGVNFEK